MSVVLLGVIGLFEFVLILCVLFFVFIIPIIALVDIIKSEFKGSNDKLIWVLIVLFTCIIGAVLYYFIGREQKVNPPVS